MGSLCFKKREHETMKTIKKQQVNNFTYCWAFGVDGNVKCFVVKVVYFCTIY